MKYILISITESVRTENNYKRISSHEHDRYKVYCNHRKLAFKVQIKLEVADGWLWKQEIKSETNVQLDDKKKSNINSFWCLGDPKVILHPILSQLWHVLLMFYLFMYFADSGACLMFYSSQCWTKEEVQNGFFESLNCWNITEQL